MKLIQISFILTIVFARRRNVLWISNITNMTTVSDSEVKNILRGKRYFVETWKIDMKSVKNLYSVRRRSFFILRWYIFAIFHSASLIFRSVVLFLTENHAIFYSKWP